MQTINVGKIIRDRNLDKKEVAKQLFPRHQYPEHALSRVLKGRGVLDANQISKLSLISEMPISAIYGLEWRSTYKDSTHTFTCEGYRAELNTKTWITKVYDNDSLFHEQVIHDGATPMGKYLADLAKIVTDYRDK